MQSNGAQSTFGAAKTSARQRRERLETRNQHDTSQHTSSQSGEGSITRKLFKFVSQSLLGLSY